MKSEFIEACDSLRLTTCSRVVSGVIGSMFDMEFQFQRHHPSMASSSLEESEQQSMTSFDFAVFAWQAVWRVDDLRRDTVVATSDDDNSPGGRLQSALNGLVGKTVTSLLVDKPGLDLRLTFGDFRLSIFCIMSEATHYALYSRKNIYHVDGRSIIRVVPRRG